MKKITADFYVRMSDSHSTVEVIGRTVIHTPRAEYNPATCPGIKWYQDTYKPEYKKN